MQKGIPSDTRQHTRELSYNEDAIHSAYDWISLELTEEEPDFPPVSDVADLGKSEGEIARNIAVNIRLFEGWDE